MSYSELLNSGRTLAQYTQALVQTYLVVAVIYVVVNGLLSRLAAYLEQRQRRRGGKPLPAQPAEAGGTLAVATPAPNA